MWSKQAVAVKVTLVLNRQKAIDAVIKFKDWYID